MLASIRRLVQFLFNRSRVEREMEEELRGHLLHRADDLERRGLTRTEAERQARIEFGGYQRYKEECREMLATRMLSELTGDIRYGLRQLRRSPGFAAVAVITLALGIGANTAIFTLLDALALRDLPVPHPEQIVHFGAHTPGDDYASVSLPMLEEIARHQTVFSGIFAWWGDAVSNVEANGRYLRADIWAVTGNFDSELGAVPEIGRLIAPADVNLDSPTPAQVAVLSYGFWQRNYGGARDVVGKTLHIEGLPFTIVGVAHKGFNGMSADSEAEITIPLTAEPLILGRDNTQKSLQSRDRLWLDAAGRLKPGVTLSQARAQLESLWPAVRRASMPARQTAAARRIFETLQMKVESFATGSSFLRSQFAKPTYILLAISGFVLLIACINLASLMLSQAAARSHEFGVRAALGASRVRLMQQMLVESMMLSCAGSLAGFALADWGSHALAAFIMKQLGYIVPAAIDLSPDLRILAFTSGLAILTGVLCCLASAWRAGREDPNSALQRNSRTIGRGTGKLGKALIVAQVALTLVLLTAAGLFIRTLDNLWSVQPGFRIDGVLRVSIYPKPNGFKNLDRVSYFHALTDRVSHLPGVMSAGIEHGGIGNGFEWIQKVHVHAPNAQQFSSDCERIMPGFFRTEGISLLQGRTFNWRDNEHAPHVVIVSQNFADKAFPRGNALGRLIDIVTEPKWQNLRIIGIVSNASLYDIRKHPQPTVYVPTLQYNSRAEFDDLLVHTNVSAAALLPGLRRAIDSLGHQYITSVKPLSESIGRSILRERVTAMLSAFFGALALVLAAIGIYGLMAYNVERRTHELGIRFALGAQRAGILLMVLRETLWITLAGIAIGVPCAVAAMRLLAHLLFAVTPDDPATLTIVSLALFIVGAIGGYIPAWRAARVEPMEALRCE